MMVVMVVKKELVGGRADRNVVRAWIDAAVVVMKFGPTWTVLGRLGARHGRRET